MTKTTIVRGGGRKQDHFGKAFDGVDRGKTLVRDAISCTVNFKFTHDESLVAFNELFNSDWYKALPAWARGEISGYADALRRGYYSPIEQAQKFAHLYDGKLYANFDHWRDAYPGANPNQLVCVTVWPLEEKGKRLGKVYHAGSGAISEDAARALQGDVYAFAD